jgi:hypothetical protein
VLRLEWFTQLSHICLSDIFDFIVGFGGASTLPVFVGPMVQAFVRNAALFGATDIWDSLCELPLSNLDVLDHTTVVIVYGSYKEGTRTVQSREIAKHRPPYRAFGHEFNACANEGCHPAVSDNRVCATRNKVRIKCAKCGWKSSG